MCLRLQKQPTEPTVSLNRLKLNLHLLGAFLSGKRVFELSYYRESILTRLMNLFAHVDLKRWKGMSVLEVGAGLGHIGDVFADLGFDVTSTDGRPDHVKIMEARGRKSFVLDCDKATPDIVEQYDLIIAFGVLYHLSHPETFIKSCEGSKVLLIETAVCDLTEAVCPKISEAKGWRGQDQALNKFGCRPSPAWVEAHCRNAGFDIIRDISNPIGNWAFGTMDWELQNSGDWKRNGVNLRKIWVFERRSNE